MLSFLFSKKTLSKEPVNSLDNAAFFEFDTISTGWTTRAYSKNNQGNVFFIFHYDNDFFSSSATKIEDSDWGFDHNLKDSENAEIRKMKVWIFFHSDYISDMDDIIEIELIGNNSFQKTLYLTPSDHLVDLIPSNALNYSDIKNNVERTPDKEITLSLEYFYHYSDELIFSIIENDVTRVPPNENINCSDDYSFVTSDITPRYASSSGVIDFLNLQKAYDTARERCYSIDSDFKLSLFWLTTL